MAEAAESGDGFLLEAAHAAAGWPGGTACELARVVFGLACAYKRKFMPLPDALAAMATLLTSQTAATAPPARQLAGEAPTASTLAAEAAETAGEGAADGRSGGLTRLVVQLDRLAVDGGGDTTLARLRKHINAVFLSLMTRLETKYAEQGHAPLPKEMPEVEKIDLLAPRSFGRLGGLAHTLRIWWKVAKHDRDRWKDLPSDREMEEVIQGAMSKLALMGW